jgi:hypothetical protein
VDTVLELMGAKIRVIRNQDPAQQAEKSFPLQRR